MDDREKTPFPDDRKIKNYYKSTKPIPNNLPRHLSNLCIGLYKVY